MHDWYASSMNFTVVTAKNMGHSPSTSRQKGSIWGNASASSQSQHYSNPPHLLLPPEGESESQRCLQKWQTSNGTSSWSPMNRQSCSTPSSGPDTPELTPRKLHKDPALCEDHSSTLTKTRMWYFCINLEQSASITNKYSLLFKGSRCPRQYGTDDVTVLVTNASETP